MAKLSKPQASSDEALSNASNSTSESEEEEQQQQVNEQINDEEDEEEIEAVARSAASDEDNSPNSDDEAAGDDEDEVRILRLCPRWRTLCVCVCVFDWLDLKAVWLGFLVEFVALGFDCSRANLTKCLGKKRKRKIRVESFVSFRVFCVLITQIKLKLECCANLSLGAYLFSNCFIVILMQFYEL